MPAAEADTNDNVTIRLLLDSDAPPRPDGSACRLGLQDKAGTLHAGRPRAGGGLAFECRLSVDAGDPPRFGGPFASGGPSDRFVYLSWARLDGAGYVNRIKVRLADLDRGMVDEALRTGAVLEADLGGRGTGGGRIPVAWRLASA